MNNTKLSVKGTILTITMDLSETPVLSGSGKSMVLATTSGFKDVPGAPGVKVSLNLITDLPAPKKD